MKLELDSKDPIERTLIATVLEALTRSTEQILEAGAAKEAETERERVKLVKMAEEKPKTKAKPVPKKKPKVTKAAKVKDSEPAEPVEAGEITGANFMEVVLGHKAKFGIDRTTEILKSCDVKNGHPRDATPEQYPAIMEALGEDKGPKVEDIDYSDFE